MYLCEDMTRRTIYYRLIAALGGIYTDSEAAAIAQRYCSEVCGFDRFALSLDPDARVEDVSDVGFEGDVARLAAGEPVQYVIGATDFCDLRLSVRPGVLIPRPETEELVARIVADCTETAPSILDIGTGSGAIAIALAAKIVEAQVSAIDLSAEALQIARANSVACGVEVEFSQSDVFTFEPTPASLDIVVSNPPYIPACERATMWSNVVDYEPAMALFVPDDSPVIFYERIADVAWRGLVSGGRLYFELHEKYASQVGQAVLDRGFVEVEIIDDFNSKPRMLRCVKP